MLAPTDSLFVPNRKRLTHSYVINSEGVRELRIDYGLKEISFDEERLFPFGEQLTREEQFTGADATTWGPGYAWDELQPLLEALIEEGIVERGEATAVPRGGGLVASPLPPSTCPVHRMWSLAECEAITRDLAGHPIEIGHVEAFVPVHRIAHPALDADDRQVGEANVNPDELRLDRETEWRQCQYPGSRYRDATPMNVTALKAMIKHWKPMMATLVAVRGELAARLGIAGPWTIGQLHALACAVLALPAFPLLERGGTSPQRPLHPVLSSLFRITDGIRMATNEMMASTARPRRPDELMTGPELYERVEQTALFMSRTGVCAGPKPMIDEFLAVAVDGAPFEADVELPDEVRALLARLPDILDYAMYGLQIWTLTVSSWLAMSAAYVALADVLATEAALADPAADARLRARLARDRPLIEQQDIVSELGRLVHARMFADAYAHTVRGNRAPVNAGTLGERLAPVARGPMHDAAAAQLRALLEARLARGERADAAIPRMVALLVDYVREEQAILAAIAPNTAAINQLLDRPAATRPLGVWDLHFNNAMTGRDKRPYFVEMLAEELGIRTVCTATTVGFEAAPRAAPLRAS
jgi:hypothetical protein